MTKIQQINKEKQLKKLVVKLRKLTDNYKAKYKDLIKELTTKINQLLEELKYYISIKRLRAIIAPVIMVSGILISNNLTAQNYGINYQAVARDSSGNILSNNSLSVKFSILQDNL